MVIIKPLGSLRKAHEDGLGSSIRFEPKDGATVIHQVELRVAATSELLPLFLLFREGIVLVLFDNGTVGSHYMIDSIFTKVKDLFWISIVQVVKEDASQSSTFAAMLDQKVVIRPLFELGIVLWIMSITDIFVGSMEVLHILFVNVDGRDIRSTTWPRQERLAK